MSCISVFLAIFQVDDDDVFEDKPKYVKMVSPDSPHITERAPDGGASRGEHARTGLMQKSSMKSSDPPYSKWVKIFLLAN